MIIFLGMFSFLIVHIFLIQSLQLRIKLGPHFFGWCVFLFNAVVYDETDV